MPDSCITDEILYSNFEILETIFSNSMKALDVVYLQLLFLSEVENQFVLEGQNDWIVVSSN